MVCNLHKGILLLLWSICGLLSCSRQPPVIYLFPVGKMQPGTLNYLSEVLSDSLKMRIVIKKPTVLPDSLWSQVRNRYKAEKVLRYLKVQYSQTGICKYLLVTDKDLGISFGPDSLRGANGLSYQNGDFAIISDYRLHQYKRPADSVNYYLTKVALHEVGHMFGLIHCKSIGCIMESVEVKQHITTLQGFCPQCKKKLSQM